MRNICNKVYYIVVSVIFISVYLLYFPVLLHRVVIKDTKLGATSAEVNAFIIKLFYKKVYIS